MSASDDWQRVDRLLEAALEQPAEERRDWLDRVCGSDAALRSRVEKLLALAESDDDLLTPGGGLHGPVADEVRRQLDPVDDEELGPGSQLGPYQIRALLGVGGMGRVYLAHDPKLGRNIAVKALSGRLAREESSLRRFEREARVLATLSHPNIASIHDLQFLDGRPYLILEYVEGPTLDELIARRPLREEQVIEIGLQIAAALEEAHGKGIVHRDLKPSNVKIDPGGRVKVLDFGLARRFVERTPEDASASVTGEGMVVGTAPYMSPEQARGEEVDARTDVWSFGCLLYEMLTGKRAFGGRTMSDLLASVLRDPVDLAALPSGTSRVFHRILGRCLHKDPRRRYQHVGDVRLELLELGETPERERAERAGPRPSRAATFVPWLLTGVALVALLFLGLGHWRTTPPAGPGVLRFVLDLPPGVELPPGDYAPPMALAPDASAVVLTGEGEATVHLYHRSLERLDWVRLPGSEGAWQPFFSPDGREVGFFAPGRLQRVALDGTTPVTVTRVGPNPRGATWTAGDEIVFGASHTSPLLRVAAQGGTPEPLTELDEAAGERSHRWPQALPGGEWVLFTVDYHDRTFDEASLALVSLLTGERRAVLDGGAHGRYLPSGHLVFARQSRLFAVPFDLATGTVEGEPGIVVEGVAYDLRNGGTKIAVADDGTLALVPDPLQSEERLLVWRGIDGGRELAVDDRRRFHDPALDPRQGRVALRIGDPMASDVWTLDLESGTLAQVTFGLRAFRPVWSPDGRRLAIGVQDPEGWRLLSVGADGQGAPVTLVESENRLYPGGWTPDGRRILFQERTADSGWDLSVLTIDADGRPVGEASPLAATPANETNPALSADGGFVAFESDEVDGPVNVYAQPFGRPGAKVIVSTGGGRWPRWGPEGELYYWSSFSDQMRRVDYRVEQGRLLVDSQDVLWAGRREPLVVPVSEFLGRGFDLDPERRRFLMLEAADAPDHQLAPRIVVALRWAESLGSRGG